LRFDDLTSDSPTGHGARGGTLASAAKIRVAYCNGGNALPAQQLLAAVRFDASATQLAHAALTIDVQLASLRGDPAAELWLANGTVCSGRSGNVRYAHDDDFLFAAIEMDEREHEGITRTAEIVYTELRRFQLASPFPHVLRIWNYLDLINEGVGDAERYRQFVVGRARGLAQAGAGPHPAATAIGRQRPTHTLQVYWLASRCPGVAVENPRQMSAYHYPRAHGPVSPAFSRATVAAEGTLLISGTASIVGHSSRHSENPGEQLEEILRNLAALIAHAQAQAGASGGRDHLKVYLRDPALLDAVATRLQVTHPHSEVMFLAGDICRRELLLEIECVRSSG
jgi:chorismate lyase / 3-hydroxybenzoate synthase